MTRIYHITKFSDSSSYIFFYGCNWNCDFCILKKYRFDIHWSKNQKNLEIKFLDLNDVINILIKNDIREVFLGGGEPTVDNSLPNLLKILKDKKIKINTLTNGELLTKEIVDLSDRIAFSIKSMNDEIHKKIVHRSNKKSLENLETLYNEKFTFETVYLKELGCKNVYEIAQFLDSIKNNLSLRVDPLIPVNEKFQRPDMDDVDNCIKYVSKNSTVKIYRIMGSGKNAKVLYP